LWIVSTAVLAITAAGDVRAIDKSWGNHLGGTFSVPGNWVGGSVAGVDDIAHFGISDPMSPQFLYTVNFSAILPDPLNQAVVVEDDLVTFDLNGKTYTTTLDVGNIIGNQLNRAASLSITDGEWEFAGLRRIDIGLSGGNGRLAIDAGGSITGVPSIVVGVSGPGTLSVVNGGDIIYTAASIGPLVGFGGTGIVNVSGFGSTIAGGSWSVGTAATGTLNITNGGSVDTPVGATAEIGDLVGGTGIANVEGGTSSWINAVDLNVGSEGNGTLNIKSGGTVTSPDGNIATSAGSTGMVTIQGSGSEWIMSDDLFVGHSGTGTLSLESGGTINNQEGHIGLMSGSDGTAHVTGPNVVWTNFGDLTVGDGGIGEMNVTAGGGVSDEFAYIGRQVDSVGMVTVSGAGSAWVSDFSLHVGEQGTGTLLIENSGSVVNTSGFIATEVNSTGTATVTGTDSEWLNSADLVVGFGGNGTLNVLDGALVQNFDAVIAGSVGSDGTVLVNGAGSEWINMGEIIVGDDDDGVLIIEAGGFVSSSAVIGTPAGILGANAGSSGTVTVTGPGSQWTTGVGDMIVGQEGSGDLTIADGSSVSNHNGFIGREVGGSGIVTVTGTGSIWTSDLLVVGSSGAGTLTIADGGSVVSDFSLSSMGTITVSGPGASWSTSFLSVAHFEDASMMIENGGTLASDRSIIASGPQATGQVTVSGTGSTWTSTEIVVIGFEGDAELSILAGGAVSTDDAWIGGAETSTGVLTVAGSGSNLMITGRLAIGEAFDEPELGPIGGTGTIHIQAGATATVGEDTALFPNAVVNLEGGTLDTDSVSFNGGGMFNFLGGTLHVGTYNGDLVNQGGTLAPGHSAGTTTIAGSYTQQAGAELEIEIGGTLAGDEYDNVIVTGTATLGGDLSIALIDGFFPSTSDTFIVLDAITLVNTFGNAANGQRLDTADDDGSFVVNYNSGLGTVTLSNFALTADYNGDGSVNAADYTVWRNSLNQSGPNLPADGNRDGMITRFDFDFWKARYGQAIGSGAGTSLGGQVPEPAAFVLFAAGLVCVAIGRRRS
jgi:T5SS/PEP-CTERM-associated repeat protein